MQTLYDSIIGLLQKYDIGYQEYDHPPILNYADAEREKQRLSWQGIESKNVFLSGSDGNFYLYVTVKGTKVDFPKLKELLGVKLSIASENEVRNLIHCVPGCVVPFGFDAAITVLLDRSIFQYTDYLFSPGITTKTIQTNLQDLKKIFQNLPNRLIEI